MTALMADLFGDDTLRRQILMVTASSKRAQVLNRAAPPLRAMAGRCTIRTGGQDHQDASVGPGGIPQCWRSGMPSRLHNWRTHPADLHPGRAQDDLRAQQRVMVQGRLGGWLLRASVRSSSSPQRAVFLHEGGGE